MSIGVITEAGIEVVSLATIFLRQQ